MKYHLEAIGLAVAHADLDLIPLTIRWAYNSGATPDQVRAAIAESCRSGRVPATIQAMALEVAHAWAWIARHKPAA